MWYGAQWNSFIAKKDWLIWEAGCTSAVVASGSATVVAVSAPPVLDDLATKQTS